MSFSFVEKIPLVRLNSREVVPSNTAFRPTLASDEAIAPCENGGISDEESKEGNDQHDYCPDFGGGKKYA